MRTPFVIGRLQAEPAPILLAAPRRARILWRAAEIAEPDDLRGEMRKLTSELTAEIELKNRMEKRLAEVPREPAGKPVQLAAVP
jgi:hypothetical protein